MKLYHYTCTDHGDPGIRSEGLVRPRMRHPLLGAQLLWLTDLAEPSREGLGLTMSTLTCDRTAVRYEVACDNSVWWWPSWARHNKVGRQLRDDLERFGLPAHWWVSDSPLPVVGRLERTAA